MVPPRKLCRKHSSSPLHRRAPGSHPRVRSGNSRRNQEPGRSSGFAIRDSAGARYRRRSGQSLVSESGYRTVPGTAPQGLGSAAGRWGALGLLGEEFACGEDRAVIVFRAQHLGSSLFAIDQTDYGDDLAAFALCSFDRFLRGTARGADFVHDRDLLAPWILQAFQLLLATVLLRFLAHQETRQRPSLA